MKFKNPNSRKVRGSHLLLISCGHCKVDIAEYQKKGRGNLLRMHIDRIIRSSVNYPDNLNCPNCGEILGRRVLLEKENEEFYRMIRSTFNTRELDY